MVDTPDHPFPTVLIGKHKFELRPHATSPGLLYEDMGPDDIPDVVIEWYQSPGTGEWVGSYFIGGEYWQVRGMDEAATWLMFSDVVFTAPLPERYDA